MGLRVGYKQTDVGMIPLDWKVASLKNLHLDISDGNYSSKYPSASDFRPYGVPFIRANNVRNMGILDDDMRFISQSQHGQLLKGHLKKNDVLITTRGEIGQVALVPDRHVDSNINAQLVRINISNSSIDHLYFAYWLLSKASQEQLSNLQTGSALKQLPVGRLIQLRLALAPLPEQRAIAEALSDVDALLGALDRLIAKKRDLKQAAMQQLLTGQTRLPGFHGDWEVKTLQESTDCLDGVRVPLNEAQRAQMKGDYPYCGANGVLDFVNSYVIDDDIILMAEDGGYFDEYERRPIAYRMSGKCWVNNHAHVLKAKVGFDQAFIFYSLVHKNILPFLASGTRAKLNKSEMNKIEVRVPSELLEQTAIAEVLGEIDAELTALDQRRTKTHALKQAMMQELLTGRTRLV